jgi:hypothetical protein
MRMVKLLVVATIGTFVVMAIESITGIESAMNANSVPSIPNVFNGVGFAMVGIGATFLSLVLFGKNPIMKKAKVIISTTTIALGAALVGVTYEYFGIHEAILAAEVSTSAMAIYCITHLVYGSIVTIAFIYNFAAPRRT